MPLHAISWVWPIRADERDTRTPRCATSAGSGMEMEMCLLLGHVGRTRGWHLSCLLAGMYLVALISVYGYIDPSVDIVHHKYRLLVHHWDTGLIQLLVCG